jgi:D-alanyl-D-alanine dipeptidase/carboxypeptidase
VYYVPALKSETTIIIPEQSAYQISGNNVDGFIITIRRKVNGQI